MNLYILKSGELKRARNTLRLNTAEGHFFFPFENVEEIYLFGKCSFNTDLLTFLAAHEIVLHTFKWNYNHAGTFFPHAANISGNVVLAQAAVYSDPAKRQHIAKRIICATIQNTEHLLKDLNLLTARVHESIHAHLTAAKEAQTIEEIMGIEGAVKKLAYGAWEPIIGKTFTRRYNPPSNPVNAVISFIYSLLYAKTASAIHQSHLHAGISFIHSPQTRRISLALDVCEPFKPYIAERLTLSLLPRLSSKDFIAKSNGIFLTEPGRRTVIEAWEETIETSIYHPRLTRYIKKGSLIRSDTFNLQKHIFENSTYRPFSQSSL